MFDKLVPACYHVRCAATAAGALEGRMIRRGRRPAAAALTALAALALSGCSGYRPAEVQRQGGILTMALYAQPLSFNPLVAGDLNSVRAYTPLFPHLYSVGADLAATPDLAVTLPSESADGTVWTIPLRPQARWSDGQPITADDVVYTIVTESDPELDTRASFDWSEVRAVSATSAHTVRITLTHPDASFLADHLTAAIVPKHVLSANRPAEMSQAVFGQRPTVSGGPFEFTAGSITSPTTYTLSANRDYYLGRPNLDTLVERVVANPADLASQLAQGQVLFAPGLSAAQADDARAQQGVGVYSFPALGYYGIQFNDRPGHLFADAATRHALDLTIDRPALVASATGGRGTVLWGDISPQSWAYDPRAVASHGRDVAAARAQLTAVGWSTGATPATRAGVSLTAPLLYPRSDPARAVAARLIASDARTAGMVLTPTGVGDTDLGAALESGSFEVALTAGGLGADPDDTPTLGCDQAPPGNPNGLNAGGFCDPAMDALLAAERAVPVTSTPAMEQQRRPIFDRIEALLAADLPLDPLWTDTRWLALNTTVSGVGKVGAQLDGNLNSAFYAALSLSG